MSFSPRTKYENIVFENPSFARDGQWAKLPYFLPATSVAARREDQSRLHVRPHVLIRQTVSSFMEKLDEYTTKDFPGVFHRNWHEIALLLAGMERDLEVRSAFGIVRAGFKRYNTALDRRSWYVPTDDGDPSAGPPGGGGGGGEGEPVARPESDAFDEILDEYAHGHEPTKVDLLLAGGGYRGAYYDEFTRLVRMWMRFYYRLGEFPDVQSGWLRPDIAIPTVEMPNFMDGLGPGYLPTLKALDLTSPEILPHIVEAERRGNGLFDKYGGFFKYGAYKYYGNLYGWMTRALFLVQRQDIGVGTTFQDYGETSAFKVVTGTYVHDFDVTQVYSYSPSSDAEAKAWMVLAREKAGEVAQTMVEQALAEARKSTASSASSDYEYIEYSLKNIGTRSYPGPNESTVIILTVNVSCTVRKVVGLWDDSVVYFDMTDVLKGMVPKDVYAYRDFLFHAEFAEQTYYFNGNNPLCEPGQYGEDTDGVRDYMKSSCLHQKVPMKVAKLSGRPRFSQDPWGIVYGGGGGGDQPPYPEQCYSAAQIITPYYGDGVFSNLAAVVAYAFENTSSIGWVQVWSRSSSTIHAVCEMDFKTFMRGAKIPAVWGENFEDEDENGNVVEYEGQSISDYWNGPRGEAQDAQESQVQEEGE